MTDLSDLETLRKALDIMERAQRSGLKADEWTTFKTARVLQAAAGRFLALTETGPDYDKADEAFNEALRLAGADAHGPTMVITCFIVDAALADYLTEEE